MIDLEQLKTQFYSGSYEELMALCNTLQENLSEIGAVIPSDEVVRLTLEAYKTLLTDALELATATALSIEAQQRKIPYI